MNPIAVPIPVLLVKRRRFSGTIPATPRDLLSALVTFLRSTPTVAAVLPLDSQSRVPVYSEMAPAGTVRPYVVLTKYTEKLPGESPQDQQQKICVHVFSDREDKAKSIALTLRNAIDVPNFNAASIGRPPLAWSGAVETLAMRQATRLKRLSLLGGGGKYVYCVEMDYDFWSTPEV